MYFYIQDILSVRSFGTCSEEEYMEFLEETFDWQLFLFWITWKGIPLILLPISEQSEKSGIVMSAQ